MSKVDFSNVASEAGVVATLIDNLEYYYSYDKDFLKPEYFTNEDNRTMYKTLVEIAEGADYKKETPVVDKYGIATAMARLHVNGEIRNTLPDDVIQDYLDNAAFIRRKTEGEYKKLADDVINAAFRKNLSYSLNKCQSLCCETAHNDLAERVSEELDSVLYSYAGIEKVEKFGNKVGELWRQIQLKGTGALSGIEMKDFPALKEFVTLDRGELFCIGGIYKSGKSMMLLNITCDLLAQGKSVVYIDSELNDRMFLMRMVSRIAGVPFSNIKNMDYTREQGLSIKGALAYIETLPFIHKYMPVMDETNISAVVKMAKHKMPALDVMVVDYFKSSGDTDAFGNSQKMGNLINVVKNQLAGKLDIAAVGAVQLNKNGDVADSQKIARYVSTLAILKDKPDDLVDMETRSFGEGMCGNKTLQITLNRNGDQQKGDEYIDIQFDGRYCKMTQAVIQHESSEYVREIGTPY